MRSLSLLAAVPPVWNTRFAAGADIAKSSAPKFTPAPLPAYPLNVLSDFVSGFRKFREMVRILLNRSSRG